MAKKAAQCWLMKSEPLVYSIDTLARDKVGTWEGVRNYQARNNLRAMQQGDLALFYHSSTVPPGVVGLMRIQRAAYPDETQFERSSKYFDAKSKEVAPRWDRVDVQFIEKFPRIVTLDALKSSSEFDAMGVCQRGSRLSVQPVTIQHFRKILALAGSQSRDLA